MTLSAVSIRRPVLATVLTLVLILFGVLSFTHLPIREYPDIDAPIVSIRTVYPGASAHIVEADVTTILEESLSGLESVKAITSTSREEVSEISVEFRLSRDLDDAANDVRDRVFSIRRWLPVGIEESIITKSSADAQAIVWLALTSDRHSALEITDYAERQIKDRLGTLPDVAAVWVWGARRYAMRIWLDTDRLAARLLTVQDVEEAIRTQNVAIPSGRIESERTEFSVRTRGELQTPAQFNTLIIAYRDGYPIRLEDIGYAELGAEDDRKLVRFNGEPALGIGVVKQSKGNTLAVARAVKDRLQSIQASLPEGMTLRIASDSSTYIERSLQEASVALGLSLLLVVVVIFAFLGNLRATMIPAVAIPASIIGGFTVMHAFGFSINVLTLLGLVLAVGLVVDDAIVVLENIHRRMELGQGPMQAAIEGSREIGFAVIATTLALVSVFVPIAFLTGTVGRLFVELAVAVAAAVLISGFVALTLTPAMSARWLGDSSKGPASLRGLRWAAIEQRIQKGFGWLSDRYRSLLTRMLRRPGLVIAGGCAAMGLGVVFFAGLGAELAPAEDVSGFAIGMTAPEGSTIRYTDQYARQIESLVGEIPEAESRWAWVATGMKPSLVTRAGVWVNLTAWEDRDRGQQAIVSELNRKLAGVPGVTAAAVNPSALSQSGKAPVQMVIRGPSYEELDRVVGLLLERAKASGSLINPETDLNLNKPELDVHVDRNKAADLGVSVASIGRTLETLLGGRTVTRFNRDGREYPVIVKIHGERRVAPSDIRSLYVRGNQGELVQLSNLVAVEETVAPRALSHHDRQRAATVTAGIAEGHTLGEGLEMLEQAARELMTSGMTVSFAGESREFKEGSVKLYLIFVVALVVIYLVLAAEFESFLHPFTILFSVPPALTGALVCLWLGGGSLNIYSQIGLIMLIGLVTKNAILIVDFATQVQRRGMPPVRAVVEAAELRLRPILMTTLATILGAIPLAVASGAGANGRHQLGIVIIGGLTFSTLLTLFIVPAMYVMLGRRPAGARVPALATQAESEHDALSVR